MKLFKMEVHTKKKRRVLDVIAHAESAEAAQALVQSKFKGCELRHCTDLYDLRKHFVIGEWETD